MVPTVSIVFLVYNRREKLRVSLQQMLGGDAYPREALDVIVVDNGSTDGSADMVRTEFPQVRLIERAQNVGVSGWNDGFASVRGDYALVLDDDCYLPDDGLRRAVEAAQEHRADLVSFSVTDEKADHRFNDDYNTGLLSFWGCAVLMRREVLEELGGYDPEIFVWANELEFMMRFFDSGFRHLHLPEVTAVHMKLPMPLHQWMAYGYRINLKHFAYIASKLLHPRDAVAVFGAIVATTVRDAYRDDRSALKALPHVVRGFVIGLRRRAPVRAEVSRLYRHNMHSFASPLAFSRRPGELIARRPGPAGGIEAFIAERARFYPDEAATLEVGPGRAGLNELTHRVRVLVLNHTSVISGGERSLLDLLDALPEDVAATVACPPGALADAVRARGLAWIAMPGMQASLRLHPVWTTRALLELLRSRRQVRRALRRERFDVVQANSLRAGLISSGMGASPRVVFVRDVLPERLTARVAAAVVARGNVRFLANSRYTAARFRELAGRGVKIDVAHSPVDGGVFDPGGLHVMAARRSLGLPEGRFVAGIVGQLTPWKGHDTAIRAVATLAARGQDVTLVVAGSPRFAAPGTRFDNRTYVSDLHRLVDRAGVAEHVRFLGERDDVATVMRALDVLLVPSWSEPFGRVVVEALTMGTRVLATSHGGPREVIEHEEDGELVAPRDDALWAEALAREIEREPDDGDASALRRERALERFGLDQHVRAVLRVWGELGDASRLRVLFVNHTGEFSGAEVVLLRLLRALPPGVAHAVACPPTGPLADALRHDGVEHLPIVGTGVSFRLHPRSTPAGLLNLMRSSAALRRYAVRWRADVIHANSTRGGLIAVGARLRTARALVVQVHDILPRGTVGDAVRRVVARSAHRVEAVSETAARSFNAGLRRETAETRYIPVDLDRFRPDGHDRAATRRSLGVPVDAPLLGEVAQITPWKGQLVAIEALAQVRERHPDAHLVLVGQIAFTGPGVRYDNAAYDREIRARVEALGLEDAVHFVGHRDDVPAVMAALDLILLPSRDEPFGTVIAEAMATGTVPLVSYDGGPAEYVDDGVSGRVLDPGHPEQWAQAAIELLDDPERREAMSRRAFEAAQQFGVDAYADAWMKLYDDALRVARA